MKMGPTVVPKTSSTNLTYTPCKTPKPKYQYSSHGESLKSSTSFKFSLLCNVMQERTAMRNIKNVNILVGTAGRGSSVDIATRFGLTGPRI